MRRIGLSALVILTFLAYSLHRHLEGAEVAVTSPTTVRQQITPPSEKVVSPPATEPPPAASTPTPAPVPTPAPPVKRQGLYVDGEYVGDSADAFYGNVQVKAVISGGRLSDIQFLDYPHDRQTSVIINQQAMPFLVAEAIQAQSAQVDIVSGATQTSEAFRLSLASALAKAK